MGNPWRLPNQDQSMGPGQFAHCKWLEGDQVACPSGFHHKSQVIQHIPAENLPFDFSVCQNQMGGFGECSIPGCLHSLTTALNMLSLVSFPVCVLRFMPKSDNYGVW